MNTILGVLRSFSRACACVYWAPNCIHLAHKYEYRGAVCKHRVCWCCVWISFNENHDSINFMVGAKYSQQPRLSSKECEKDHKEHSKTHQLRWYIWTVLRLSSATNILRRDPNEYKHHIQTWNNYMIYQLKYTSLLKASSWWSRD